MPPPRSFRLNQYNWLGQKLAAQHRYEDVLKLRESLTHQRADQSDVYIGDLETSVPLSDHLSYLTGLALMKKSDQLEDLIFTLQKLSFQKNSQYFLLLCQCLLYLGNHDSVVAICKQVINREISMISSKDVEAAGDQDDQQDGTSDDHGDEATQRDTDELSSSKGPSGQQLWYLEQICEESVEFRKIFESVNRNSLINDPRLWFIFALSLEHQLQFKDADLAHRVACKLASGQARQIFRHRPTESLSIGTSVLGSSDDDVQDQVGPPAGISNYYLPHTNYSEFCIRHRGDYRTAMQILSQVSQIAPPINYTLNPLLALTLCSQANSNVAHFTKALEMIASLDNHTNALRNPSFIYNQLALKCKQKLHYYNETTGSGGGGGGNYGECYDYLQRVCDEKQTDLEYSLIKSHILINSIVQSAMHNPILYKWSQGKSASANEAEQIFNQIDKLIDTLRNCDTSCWSSHSLWNNLGVCYLMKRRYVASLSCLMKAHQLNPLDWRVNYNLSLVYLHVGNTVRALCSSLASRGLSGSREAIHATPLPRDQMISTMIAISYSELGLTYEARRFYAELVAQGKSGRVLVISLVNYLLLLQQDESTLDDQDSNDAGERVAKSSYRLLDLLEQGWLQRSPSDAQFSHVPLDVASQIGQTLGHTRPHIKKNFAWTKHSQI